MKTYYSFLRVSAKACVIIFCLLFIFFPGFAQTIELVKDINPTGASSVTNKIDLNGLLIFGAYETFHGSELWRSDGTDTGTYLIRDINPGSANANVMNLQYHNGKIYFSADDGIHGREVWITDGDSSGTYMLKDIHPTGSGSFSSSIVFNNLLFFNADDGVHGNEWWTTDGTINGTQLFVDSSSIGGGPEKPYIFSNKLYFAYNNGIDGREPWVTDGTPAGTHLVLNINQTNSLNSLPEDFTEYNGLLFFHADDGVAGSELWVTDGTSNGTQMVKDIRPGAVGSFARNFIVFNNLIYFDANDGTNGVELWVSNGTNAGTVMLKDIHPSGSADLVNMVEYNNQLFFSAIDGIHGREPWLSDGTGNGTQMLLDINPTGNSMTGYFSFINTPTKFDGKLFFVADEGTNGYEMWVTDGSVMGTQLIEPAIVTGTSPLNSFNDFQICSGFLYFDANYDGMGEDLYRVVSGSSGIAGHHETVEIIKIFPNPASDHLTIEWYGNIEKAVVIIRDIAGRIIYTNVTAETGKLDVNTVDFAQGVYLVQMQTKDFVTTKKVIIVK